MVILKSSKFDRILILICAVKIQSFFVYNYISVLFKVISCQSSTAKDVEALKPFINSIWWALKVLSWAFFGQVLIQHIAVICIQKSFSYLLVSYNISCISQFALKCVGVFDGGVCRTRLQLAKLAHYIFSFFKDKYTFSQLYLFWCQKKARRSKSFFCCSTIALIYA